MDLRRALQLQVEWGADEALEIAPQQRLGPRPAAPPIGKPPSPAKPPAAGMPATLAEFARALAAFDGAGLAATATRLVFPVGPEGGLPEEGLLVVGEAPGAEEDRSGQPFVGPPGQLLRRMLLSIGIDPHQVMLAYVAPWRPPGGRAPSEIEIAACLPLLHRLIVLARPRYVLALGGVPAKALLGPATRRGKWGHATIAGQDEPVAVLPTANPAVLLRQPQQKAAAWFDLRLLRRKIDGR